MLAELDKISADDLPPPPALGLFGAPAANAKDFFSADNFPSLDTPSAPSGGAAASGGNGSGNTFDVREVQAPPLSGNPTELLQQLLQEVRDIRTSLPRQIAQELGVT